MPVERITETDINAYIDGELDLGRRFAVEDHLANNPAAAARVMADLSIGTALRLALTTPDNAPAALTDAAEQLETRLGGRRHPIWNQVLRMRTAFAAAAIVAGIGIFASLPDNAEASPPAYVADAVMAFQTGMLRASMTSQIESQIFDAHDIRQSTSIRVPTLPNGWQVTDVQLFPSDSGPALQIMVRTPSKQVVSIFAVRSPDAAPARPVAIQRGTTSVAYWRHGDMAYALTGIERPEALDLAAQDLADNRID